MLHFDNQSCYRYSNQKNERQKLPLADRLHNGHALSPSQPCQNSDGLLTSLIGHRSSPEFLMRDQLIWSAGPSYRNYGPITCADLLRSP